MALLMPSGTKNSFLSISPVCVGGLFSFDKIGNNKE